MPAICREGQEVWTCVVPLICFHIVEWHQPDRCLRQFGLRQFIPSKPSQLENLHQITLRGKTDDNWQRMYGPVLEAWNNRLAYAVEGLPPHIYTSENDEYMVWYRRKSKLYISRENARNAAMVIRIKF